jgi:hypothetical protein
MNDFNRIEDFLNTKETQPTPKWFKEIESPLTLTPFLNHINPNEQRLFMGNSGLFIELKQGRSGKYSNILNYKPNAAFYPDYLSSEESNYTYTLLGASVISLLDYYKSKADNSLKERLKVINVDVHQKYLNTLSLYLDHVGRGIYTRDFKDESHSLTINMDSFVKQYQNRLSVENIDLSIKMLRHFFSINQSIIEGKSPSMFNPRLNRFKDSQGNFYYDI